MKESLIDKLINEHTDKFLKSLDGVNKNSVNKLLGSRQTLTELAIELEVSGKS